MKKQLVFTALFALFIFCASASGFRVTAQDESITGGYGTLSVKSKDARTAANFAINAQSTADKKKYYFVKLLKAETQLVAGLNYRICMLVRERKGRSKSVTAVVYKDLKNNFSLTAWKAGGCTEL